MADSKTTIQLIFEGVDKTGAATQAALNNTNKFATGVQTATQPIADFTVGALKLEAGLLAVGAAIALTSVKIATDFQSAVASLNKVLGEGEDIQAYSDLALELSDNYGVAAVNVLNSITDFKQAGYTAEEAAILIESSLALVIAGEIEAATASDLLVAAMKGFGIEAAGSAATVDLLNQVSNEYATNVEELLTGFSQLSPVAKTAGFSLQETIGILTPGIEVFRSGSEVAAALRTSLLKLVDDNPTVVAALEQLGVSQTDVNGELRSARDIYFDVAAAIAKVDENQKIKIASDIVGINRTSQFLAVTAGLNDTLRISADSYQYLGSAAEEVAVRLATAEIATNRAKESLTNLFVVLGTPILDEYTGIADSIRAIFNAIGEASALEGSGLNDVVSFVEEQFRGLEATISQIAANLPAALENADFTGFIDGLGVVGEALSNLFDGVDLSSEAGLIQVIEGIGDAFNGLSQYTAGVIDSLGPAFDAITDVLGSLQELDPETIRSFGSFGGAATQVNILSGAIVGLTGAIGLKGAGGVVGALGSLASASTAALGAVGGLSGLIAGGALATGAAAAGYGVGTLANSLIELATGYSASTWATDLAIKLGLVDDAATNIVDGLNKVPDTLDSVAMSADESARAIAAADAEMENITRNSATASEGTYDLATALAEAEQKMDAMNSSGELLPQLYGDIDKATASVEKLNEAAAKNELEKQLAIIEAQTQISVANIEADAKKTVAAFDSITVSIQDTGENLRELYGLFSEADSISDKFFIEDQIELQNDRQQEALDQQSRLIDAQIAELRAKAKRLASGDTLITINGDGLQPHLEAFMWEILEILQVRVNADGLDMLLGAP